MVALKHSQILRTIPFLIAVCLSGLPAHAKYSGGTGEPNDPYQIATAADLIALGETPEDYDKHLLLTGNIDLDPDLPGRKVFDKAVIAPDTNEVEDGFQGIPFAGDFDGNGHAISHLTIKGGGYLGLFGCWQFGAEVRNLHVVDVNITGSGDRIGGLVGAGYGGQATHCHSAGIVTGNDFVGGLVGENGSNVDQCYSTAMVTGRDGVGGLVGVNGDLMARCYSAGTVKGQSYVGGLVGWNLATVTGSFWDSQTSGQTTSTGGTGKTTAEMRTAGTFLAAGWDFLGETANGSEDIWSIDESKDYPHLWWEAAEE